MLSYKSEQRWGVTGRRGHGQGLGPGRAPRLRTLVAVQPLPGGLAEGPGSPRARRPPAPARVPPHACRPSSSRPDSDGFAASSCPCRPISLPLILARQTRQELLRARAAAHARRLPEMPPWPAPSLRARGSRSLEDPARCQPPDGRVGCSWQTWKCCLTAQGTRIMTLGGVLGTILGPEMAHGFSPWFWALERAPIPCRMPSVRLHGVRARL